MELFEENEFFKIPQFALTAEAQRGSFYFDLIIDVVSCHRFLNSFTHFSTQGKLIYSNIGD